MTRCYMLADGKVDVTPLITGTVGLDGVENAFDALGDPEAHADPDQPQERRHKPPEELTMDLIGLRKRRKRLHLPAACRGRRRGSSGPELAARILAWDRRRADPLD